ncbi:sulfotransferase family 2 domain-containing protein [Coraliomargarita sp. SDUM461003]|uniref:Sulfotransferase family 2 domain-containing protein n=1 Tax=Thalassobacterium maritimum TaxID=3041265 RepID=A0ABU1AZG4_9BACT|nr:sulfotransferase family 2 domain-containing protein [Coraliomargarita sp. SDUM461003]MDQ8208535.1 sulfotransferase family 2 domain-containing protein [Coraliomargarita sp. SDUM461003]
MLFSKKYQFIFFCNPKTGTTSTEAALKQLDDVQLDHYSMPCLFPERHIPPTIARAFFTQAEWDAAFKFVFVRHPYDWVVSQYRWNFPPPLFYLKKFYWVPGRWRDTIREYMTYRQWIHKQVIDAETVDFLYDFLKRFRCLPNRESLFQYSYTTNLEGENIVDYIGRFESFDESIAEIQKRLGIELNIPHINVSKRSSAKDALTSDARQRIQELWREDFERLGYSMDAID